MILVLKHLVLLNLACAKSLFPAKENVSVQVILNLPDCVTTIAIIPDCSFSGKWAMSRRDDGLTAVH